MKSFFTNLGKLLLCGATVAMIGCTDLHSDLIQVEENSNKEIANLQSTIDQLEAKLQADYALKSELETVKAQIADEKAALEAAIAAGDEAAIAAAKADLDAAVAQVTTAIEGINARLDALEAAVKCEEIAAQLAALDAYVLAMEEAIIGRLDTVEQALSAVTVLLEDEAAARQIADEELWLSIYDLQEVITALDNKINDIQAQEYVTAEQLAEVYSSIDTANAAISSVYNQLLDLAAKHDQDVEEIYGKINVVEEALSALVFTVTDVQDELAAQLAALETLQGYIEELYLADQSMQEYYTQLLNSVNAQIEDLEAAHEEIYAAYYQLQEQYTQLMNALMTADDELRAEMESLISETKNELGQAVTFLSNLLSDYTGQIDDLAARVQSLVFIPEYSDGKATIEWGLLIDNDSAVNFILNRILTASNINAFKNVVYNYIDAIKNVILDQAGNLEQSLNDFLAGFTVDTPAIETALAQMLKEIENLVAAEVAKVYNQNVPGANLAIPSTQTPEQIAADIMAEIVGAFQLGGNLNFDITSTVQSYLSAIKATGVTTVKELIDLLQSVSVNDVIANLNSAEFKSLLSKMLSVAKSLEAKVLENTALLKKESVIRYKVQAQNAAAVAAAIAANPSVLSYDVEAVDVRAAAPGLKITKVAAKGDELHVTVVPQNFHYRFYLTYILEDSFLYGAAESFFDKFGKTGLISYSAALVLNDGNNIRSTEYVNFVSSENPEIFTPEVIKNGAVVENETIEVVKGEDEEITLCQGMYMGYLSVPNRTILTKAQLEEKGYFGITEKAVVATTNGEAGPCSFEGLTGTVNDWYDYTFTTYWSVNDIVLAVESDLVWSLPESVVVWEGTLAAGATKTISFAADDIAPWFDGIDPTQEVVFECEIPEDGPACIHLYQPSSTTQFAELAHVYEAGKISIRTDLATFYSYFAAEEAVTVSTSNLVIKKVVLYL